MPNDAAAAKSGGAVELPTNNGLVTRIREVEVDDWEHGMVDDPLGYVALRAEGPPKALTPAQIERYDADGYVHDPRWGCRAGSVMSEPEALGVGEKIKEMELRLGKGVNGFGPMHLTQKWWHDIVTNEQLLDAVEDLLGPNILVWASQFWCKEPGSSSFVAWHQDTNYWGLRPDHLVTAWVAFSDVSEDTGPMEFVKRTYLVQLEHEETYNKTNLLSRGQEIAWPEEPAPQDVGVDVLRPGEFSLHHIRLAHRSGPNNSPHRRLGMAIRYMPTWSRSVLREGIGVMLVRGVDEYGHFRLLPPPAEDSDENPGDLVGDTGVLDGGDPEAYAKVMAERENLNVPAHLKPRL